MGIDWAIDQAVEIEDSLDEVLRDPDFSKITEGTTFKKALGDTEDKVVEGNIDMIGMMIMTEVGIGQEIGHSQEIIVVAEIEAQATVGGDQDLEPAPIGTEQDATIVESMIILQGIVPPLGKKGTCSKC